MQNFDFSALTILNHKDVPAFKEQFQKTLRQISDDTRDSKPLKELVFRFIARNEKHKPGNGLIDPMKIKRVLLLRYDAVGDYMLTTPVPRMLKALNPDMKIDMVVSTRNGALASANPLLDNIYTVEKITKSFNSSLVKVIRQAKKNKYDVIFGLVFHSMTVNSYLAAEISPAAEKITMQYKGREHLYGKIFNRQITHSYWREHYINTMCRTVTDNFAETEKIPSDLFTAMVYLKNSHFENIQDLIYDHDLKFKFCPKKPHINPGLAESPENNGKFPYIIFNLTSTVHDKKLAPEIAAAAIKLLAKEKPHVKFFVTAAPSESDMIDKTVDLSGTPNCLPIKKPLNEFIAFLSGSAMLISPDTGTVHIAAALGLPQIVLYNIPESICEWTPYDNEFYGIVTGSRRHINIIEPETILETAQKFDRFNEI